MKIKRPLCLICLALTAAVWIFLKVIPVPEPDYYQKADGSMMSFTGEVIQKEYRMDFTGKKIPVLYLQSASDRESCVQCYMDTGQCRCPADLRIFPKPPIRVSLTVVSIIPF